MSMHRNKFKFETSITIVVSHIAIFFVALVFELNYGFGEGNAFNVMSATIPLFGLFLSIIIKDTIAGQFDLSAGRLINAQMVWVTRLILASYVAACMLTFVLFWRQAITTPEELSGWISTIEAALGVSLGMLVDSLFGGNKEEQQSTR